ncbi:MAG: APC family permease [Bacteroidota bacterium]
MNNQPQLTKSLGTRDVMVAGVALVVAASTLVSDFNGYFSLGIYFAVALVIAFVINLLLGLSAASLSVAYPRAGALYNYAQEIFKGKAGRWLSIFLGLSFFSMIALTMAGEAAAGAFGLKALLGVDLPLSIYILVLSVLAVIPNVLGIRTTAWVSAGLLLLMLGVRWFFGLAGFFGWGSTQAWSWQNLLSVLEGDLWTGSTGILTVGLALAFWSFVGIEFACSLAEEVKDPKKSLPKGIVLGLIVILATSLVMGIGVTGALPLTEWQAALQGVNGNDGESPQLAVGFQMFGQTGYYLMALASVAATLGTLTVTYAAMPRLLYSMSQDGVLFGKWSTSVARLHPRSHTPVVAILITFGLYMIPALYNSQVIDWIFSAAYIWILLYVVFHTLVIFQRSIYPRVTRSWVVGGHSVAISGILITLFGLYYAFAGAHGYYGSRAVLVLGGVLLLSVLSYHMSRTAKRSIYKKTSKV